MMKFFLFCFIYEIFPATICFFLLSLFLQVLNLLIKAWKRRLIFTIGTSTTTGEANTVTWNEIHHKTELYTNYTGHGYPDPNYLDNVLLELAAQGVIDDGSSDESDSEIKTSPLDSGVEMTVSS